MVEKKLTEDLYMGRDNLPVLYYECYESGNCGIYNIFDVDEVRQIIYGLDSLHEEQNYQALNKVIEIIKNTIEKGINHYVHLQQIITNSSVDDFDKIIGNVANLIEGEDAEILKNYQQDVESARKIAIKTINERVQWEFSYIAEILCICVYNTRNEEKYFNKIESCIREISKHHLSDAKLLDDMARSIFDCVSNISKLSHDVTNPLNLVVQSLERRNIHSDLLYLICAWVSYNFESSLEKGMIGIDTMPNKDAYIEYLSKVDQEDFCQAFLGEGMCIEYNNIRIKDFMPQINDDNSERLMHIVENEKKIRDLKENVHILEIKVNAIQEEYERKLANKTLSDDEKEELYQAFSERILKESGKLCKGSSNEKRKAIEDEVKSNFDIDSWNKMNSNSKKFLVTARLVYNFLCDTDDTLDFACVCVSMAKALENELFCKLYEKLLNHYEYNEIRIEEWNPGVTKKYNKKLCVREFTLGSIPHILGNKEKYKNNVGKAEKIRKELITILKADVFISTLDDTQIDDFLGQLDKWVDDITEYRNKAAHKEPLEIVDAKKCYDILIIVEKALIKFISYCR